MMEMWSHENVVFNSTKSHKLCHKCWTIPQFYLRFNRKVKCEATEGPSEKSVKCQVCRIKLLNVVPDTDSDIQG